MLIIARIIAMGKDSCQPRAFSSFVELQNRLSSRRKTFCLSFSRVLLLLIVFAMEPERPVKATVSYDW